MLERIRRFPGRHPLAVDRIIAALVLIVGVAAVLGGKRHGLPVGSTTIEVALLAGAVSLRRPFPVPATGLVLTAVILDRATRGGLSHVGIGWAAVVLVSYSAGAHAGRREGLIGLCLLLAAMGLVYASVAGQKGTAPSEWLWELAMAAAPYGVGRLLRARRRLHAELEDRALALTHEREQRERLAVGVERARIARELHDVAAHSLSLMIVQAGAARSVLDTSPEAVASALEAIASTGRQTMADMGQLLGFLQTGEASSLGGVSRVGDLVAQARQAGLPVEVEIAGTARRLPPEVDLAAYRVVQEALTNALKHSGGARTEVLIEYGDDALRVEVSDDGNRRVRHPLSATGAGQGLRGMRERIEMVGGELTTGRNNKNGWTVAATLPTEAEPSAVTHSGAPVAA
jgi:signal transduction histidine kinase